MSRENVEKLRALHEALNRGDIDVVVQALDPEVEARPAIVAPDGSSHYRGRDGIREFLESLRIWEEQWVEAEEILEAPGDRVLAVERWHTRGRDDIRVDFDVIDVYAFRGGLIVRIDGFLEKADALEAAGLREQAVSQENVEVVRRTLEAANRRDWPAVVAELDPEVEIDDRDILDADDYLGHAAFFEWLARWNESWDSWRMEDIEILPVGEDRVVALFRMVVEGKRSGIEIDRRDALTYTFRSGKVVEMGYYNDQQQALEAVGLAE